MQEYILNIVDKIGSFGNAYLFYPIKIYHNTSIPLLILWILFVSAFLTIKLNFINIKFLPSAIKWCFGKKYKHNSYNINPKKLVMTTIGSATDLGSVFGIALGVTIGGPGVIFWLLIAGFLSTSIRFTEVYLSHKYRYSINNSRTMGGPFVYIEKIFQDLRLKKLGKIIAYAFAASFTISTLCSLQVNQAVQLICEHTELFKNHRLTISLLISTSIILTIKSGAARVAKISSKIVPPMTIIYFISTFLVIAHNYKELIPSIKLIIQDGLSFKKVNSNIFGCLVIGMQRAFFCNEAGMGSAAIIHASSENKNTFIESVISMVGPIISILIVCLCSGLLVVITKTYTHNLKDGILIIIQSFNSTHKYLSYIVFPIIPIFGFTTAISWGYGGSRTWSYMFGEKYQNIYFIILFLGYILCGMINDFSKILNIADFINLSITIPNLICLLFASFAIKRELKIKTITHPPRYE